MVHETNSNNFVIENTSDGYIDNVKLDGKTLVNLWGNKASDFLLSGQATFNEESGYVELASTSHRYSNVFTKYTGNLKPNTLYTIIVDVVENTFAKSDIPILKISSSDPTQGYSCFNETRNVNGGRTGKFVFTITTISDFSNVNIGLRTFVDNINSEVGCKLKFRIIILEGDHTQNVPKYFKGLKSVGEDVDKIIVLSTKSSGNLLHCEGFSMVSNGLTLTYNPFEEEYTLNGTCTTDNTCFFPHNMCSIHNISLQGKYSGRLVISNPNVANFNVRFYEKSFTRGVILNNKKLTHTGNYNNGDIVGFSIRVDNGQTFNNDKFKVCFNKGDTPIPYEPYEEHKKELLYKDVDGVWKKPALCEWNTIEKHDDGKWYYHKRSEQIILSNNRAWTMLNTTPNLRYYTIPEKKGKTGTQKIINDFTTVISDTYNNGNNHIGIDGKGNIVLGMDRSKVDITYLINNPITFVYELAQEEIYECLPIPVASYKSETTYKIDSGVITPASTFELDYSLGNAVGRISDVKAYNSAMIDNLKTHINKIREVL